MKSKKSVLKFLIFLGCVLLFILIMQFIEIIYGGNIAMLYPKGIIALKQRNLLFLLQGLMFIVVIPVFFLTFYFAWKYRASNTEVAYTPNWDNSILAECIWWGVPFLLVLAISILTWIRTDQLDPFKPIESDKAPIKIQVIALQWKWLFIYPEQKIATLNFVEFPEKTPLNFEITSDAPMNSFWIPQLGGQIYAMPKMITKLHLIADAPGNYHGSSANISGKGFSGMHFIAKATSEEDFKHWVANAQKSSQQLTLEAYQELAKPSENNPVATYSLKEEDLFNEIIMKYTMPPAAGKK